MARRITANFEGGKFVPNEPPDPAIDEGAEFVLTLRPTAIPNRDAYMTFGVWFGVLGTIIALSLGGWHAIYQCVHVYARATIIGICVFGPPLFLWFDWIRYCPGLAKDEREQAKHTHDLTRNLWVALSILLVALFGFTISV